MRIVDPIMLTMNARITRRDFVSGIALGTAGLGLSPIEAIAEGLLPTSVLGPDYYPPGLIGMRGSHPGSFEVAHAVARDGKNFAIPDAQTGSTYDLIVVGGGISGLSAAKFFRDRRKGRSNILVLDNHDDFGGHAKRNEFDVDGKTLLCFGGSQTIDNPSKYSTVAKQLLQDLAIDTRRFYDYFDQDYFTRRMLKHGMYFDRATYGVDRVITNLVSVILSEPVTVEEAQAAVSAMPINEADQADFLRLLVGGVDYLDGKSIEEKIRLLRNISYLDFLEKFAGMPASVRGIMQDTFLPLTSVGWEAASAWEAAAWWFPGTWELGVQEQEGDDEPYIHHFPDGNASVARSLVRDLIPAAIRGSTMEDLVTARADYSFLDMSGSAVRIRLNSTAVDVRHTPEGKFVDVTYVNDGSTYRVRGKHVILACYNNIIPHICPEVPEQQADAIRYATKVPFVIGNIAIRNWRAFAEAGYHAFYSPGDLYFKFLMLDFPVSMGDYDYSKGPDEPIVISGWYSPTTRGRSAKQQYRAGQRRLLEMTYDDFEQNIYSHLDGMLGRYGFNVEREIAAITLNRWPHGYAYEFEGVGVPADYDRQNGPHIAGRTQIGRISIANSDSEAYAYVDGAIDAADRAVNEQLS